MGITLGRSNTVHAERTLDDLNGDTECGRGSDMITGTDAAVTCKSCIKISAKRAAEQPEKIQTEATGRMEIGPRENETVDTFPETGDVLRIFFRTINGTRYQFNRVEEKERVVIVVLNCTRPDAQARIVSFPKRARITPAAPPQSARKRFCRIKPSKGARSRALSRVGR